MRMVLAALLVAVFPAMAQSSAHVGNAVRLMQDRHYADAAKEFELALAADPNYPSAAIIKSVAGLIVNSPDLSEDES